MICQRLKSLRLARRLTQQEVADALNISRSAYALYEAGKRQLGYETLLALADFYGVSLDYLFCRTETPEPPGVFTQEERSLLERYRALDRRGQGTLRALLDWEQRAARQRE